MFYHVLPNVQISYEANEIYASFARRTRDPSGAHIVVTGVSPVDCSKFPFLGIVSTNATSINHIKNRPEQLKIVSLRGNDEFMESIHSTSEHTIFLILSIARRVRKLAPFFCGLRQGKDNWKRKDYMGDSIHGRSLMIIGNGRVGRQVAMKAAAMGMKVKCFDVMDYRTTEYFAFLSEADYVSLHASYNDEVLFDEAEISTMKKGFRFINTSRGELVNENILWKRLWDEPESFAALDVLTAEPKPKNIKDFLRLENCIVTPHIAGCTEAEMLKTQLFVAQKTKEYVCSNPAMIALLLSQSGISQSEKSPAG